MSPGPRRSRGRVPLLSLGIALSLAILGCSDDPTNPDDGLPEGPYSRPVQRIFNQSCATAGCHGAGETPSGLELTSWETVIAGSRYGEVVIPFRPEESHLLDHLLGIAEPRMPLSRDPLPDEQIATIRVWIEEGARNDAGEIPYATSARKIYVTNQAGDKISVIDTDAQVVSRIIDVGVLDGVDSPHNVHVDRQNRYWYVSLINSARLLQFDARTDELVRTLSVGESPANPCTSPDGSEVYVTNWNPTNATLHVIDTETLTEKYSLRFPAPFGVLPHGLAVTQDGSTLYTTHEGGGSVFRIRLGQTAAEAEVLFVSLGEPAAELHPLQVVLDAEEQFLYVTCNGTGEVRVVSTETLEVVKTIQVQGRPWLATLAPGGLIYVCNWGKDAVDIIDTQTQELVTSLTNSGEHPVFARPHGVAITGDGRFAFVSNENTNGGIPQHHPTQGGGDKGHVSIIDLATNHVVKVLEVEEDPTGVAYVEFR
jgi:YVTN family beta-propeller protein